MAKSTKKQIIIINSTLKKFTESIMKALSLNCVANFREDNPFDTGWSRSNWILKMGKKFMEVIGSKKRVSNASQEKSIAKIASSYTLPKGRIYISNGVSYIESLNNGSSAQAPAGFVQSGMHRAVSQTSKLIK